MLNALTFMCLAFFRTHISSNKTLQLLLDSFKLIMNQYLSATVFKLIRVGLTMVGSSFNDTHLVVKNSLKSNKHYIILFLFMKYL